MSDTGESSVTAGTAGPAHLRIFLNYRRGDSGGHAGRLYDSLTERFGEEHVFMDVDKIAPGTDYVEAIDDAVGSCDVLLAVIGRDWHDATDAGGHRRLDNPNDFVRLEIEAALDRDVRIFPLLVQGATMPDQTELPGKLARLARRNALELSDTRWSYDVQRLEGALKGIQDQFVQSHAAPAPPPSGATAGEAGGAGARSAATRATAPATTAAAATPAPPAAAGTGQPPLPAPPQRSRFGDMTPRTLALIGGAIIVVVVVAIVAASGGGGSSKPKAKAGTATTRAASQFAGPAVAHGTGPCSQANLDACFPPNVNGGDAAPPLLPTAETGPGTSFALSNGLPSVDSSAQSALGATLAVAGTYDSPGKQGIVVLAAFPSDTSVKRAFSSFVQQANGRGCQSYAQGNLSNAQNQPNGNWEVFTCGSATGTAAGYFLDHGTLVTFTGLTNTDTLRFLTSWVGNGS